MLVSDEVSNRYTTSSKIKISVHFTYFLISLAKYWSRRVDRLATVIYIMTLSLYLLHFTLARL